MRRHLVTSALVATFCALCAISGCNVLGEDKPSACEQDEALCPTSSRQATDIGCDCHCVAGYAGITPTRDFDGEISACLPPSLNLHLSTPEQRDAANALSQAQFNQKVFKYCSDTIATYVTDLIEEQQRPRDLGAICVGPRIKCKCTTAGAHDETSTCAAPCADKECDQDNCQPLLKVGGILDASGCQCSRVSSCGAVAPPAAEPPVCLNRIAAILKRKTQHDAGAN